MSNTKPLTDQSGRAIQAVITPEGMRFEVLGDPIPPSQRGATIHVDPKGGGRPHGDFPVKHPNSGPTAKQKKPTPKTITPIDNNTLGRVYTMQLPPPGAQNQNTRLAPDGRPWHEMGWDEIERVGAEAFERWKKAAQTAWDALPGTADAATTAAARQSIGEGAVNTLEGLGTLLGPPAEFTDAAYLSGNADAIALVEQMQQNQRAAIGAIGDSVKTAWNEAYARNGAVGASAMVLATLGIEAVGGKGLGALGKAAGTIADIVRVAKTPMEAAKKLDEAIAAAKATGASADEIALLERARAERLAQARREAAQGKDGVVVTRKDGATVSSLSDIPTSIHPGQQGKHIPGHNNYIPGRSTINSGVEPQELLDGVHGGRYPIVGSGSRGQPIVDFGRPIGVDASSGLPTSYGTIHSGNNGAHIVPTNPTTVGEI